jgi:dTDP-4-dehydrorhamnose reductase
MSPCEQIKLDNLRVMVLGASGLVGQALLSEFQPDYWTCGTFCKNSIPGLLRLDLRDQNEVDSVLQQERPDLILCSAAEPSVELCEIDPTKTRRTNVEGLQNLIMGIRKIGAALVYFSSEYVFDGVNGPYSENDTCNPLNEYGRQKLECEQMISSQLTEFIIGRISGVYNWERQRKNFVVRLIDSLHAGKPMEVPYDQIITPTYAPNLAQCVRLLIQGGHWGLFHLSGPVAMPRTEFAYLIAKVFELDETLIVSAATSALNLHATRPRSAGLKLDKVRALGDVPVVTPRQGLETMRQKRASNLRSVGRQAN